MTTLAEVNKHFCFCRNNLSDMPLKLFMPPLKDSKESGLYSPDLAMELYYLGQHYLGAIKDRFHEHEQLPENVVKALDIITRTEAQQYRALHYLMLITVREARHINGDALKVYENTVSSKEYAPAYEKLKKMGQGKQILNFVNSINGTGSESAIGHFLMKASSGSLADIKVGEFYHWICAVFDVGGFGGGFGGQPWHQITRAAYNYFTGAYSLSMLSDATWALSHNNGPIFNKHVVFSKYTDFLLAKLDVQRAGLMPELVNESKSEKDKIYGSLHAETRNMLDALQHLFPIEIAPYVDWQAVEKEGESSWGGYMYKNHQAPKYGEKPKTYFDYGLGTAEAVER